MKISPIGFGTWKVMPEEAKDVIIKAMDIGYTNIDLAYQYQNERELGYGFKEYFANGKHDRSKYFITTKVWNTNHNPAHLRKQVEEQLSYVGLDYFDQILVHWPVHEAYPGDGVMHQKFSGNFAHGYGMRDVWRAMEKLVDDGKCKYIGLSNFPVASILDILSYCRIKPFSNQVESNIWFPNTKLIDWCLKNGIKIFAYRPIGGRLIDQVLQTKGLAEIAAKHGQTEGNIILRWHKQRYPTDDYILIPKTSNPERMKTNIDVVINPSFTLTDEEMKTFNAMNLGKKGKICVNEFIPIFD